MPKFKKLTPEELAKPRPPANGERAKNREEYKGFLKGLKAEEGGELLLSDDEKKITIKNRLKRAAEDMGLNVVFKRSGENSVRFQLKGE